MSKKYDKVEDSIVKQETAGLCRARTEPGQSYIMWVGTLSSLSTLNRNRQDNLHYEGETFSYTHFIEIDRTYSVMRGETFSYTHLIKMVRTHCIIRGETLPT